MARVRLLPPRDLPGEHRPFAEALDAQGAFINVYRAMAHSPVAMRRFYDLVASLWSGALTDRLREIAILSVVSASDAQYPLGWHVLDAEEVGLTAAEVHATISGDTAETLTPLEAAVARFARDLALDACVSDAAFQAVRASMDEQQIVELTMLAGLYRSVACFANALGIELDDEAAKRLRQRRGVND